MLPDLEKISAALFLSVTSPRKMSAALYLGEIRSRAWRGCMAEDAPTRILRDPHPSDPDTLGHILVLDMREISAKFFVTKG
jgi:hypothetical protein